MECTFCGGTGNVSYQKNSVLVCPKCGGFGRVATDVGTLFQPRNEAERLACELVDLLKDGYIRDYVCRSPEGKELRKMLKRKL